MIHVAHANESRMVISYVKRTRYKSRQISATDSSNGSKREREGVNRESERAKEERRGRTHLRLFAYYSLRVCGYV